MTEFKLYDRVRIKANGIYGQIIDISIRNHVIWYIVESEKKGKRDDAYPSEWPLYDCTENEMEKA